MRTCIRCGLTKELTAFYSRKGSKDGLRADCKSCFLTQSAKAYKDCPEIKKARALGYYRDNTEARKLAMKVGNQRHRAKRLISKRAYYENRDKEADRERRRLYRLANIEHVKQKRREHYDKNKASYVAHARKREAYIKRATPAWADLGKILVIYQQSGAISRGSGIPHHVDHVVPLRSRTVCGLHVHYNLQILTADDNLTKSNH